MAVGRSTGSTPRSPTPLHSNPGSNQAADTGAGTELDLSWKPMSPEEVSDLAARLSWDPQVRSLNLDSCALSADNIRTLCDALISNGHSNLASLSLSGNTCRDVADTIASLLKNSQALTALNIGSCRLGAEGVRTITLAAASSGTLRTLSLGGNLLGTENWGPLARLLELNTLTQLHIDFETAGDTGFHAFCTALKDNTGLRQLVLGHQGHELNLSLDQEKWLSDALAENRSLENFGIYYLCVLAADGTRLNTPEGLSRNSGLQSVCIRAFNFNERDADVLTNILKNPNSRVSRLSIDGGWDRRAAYQVTQAAIDNTNLRSFPYSSTLLLGDTEKQKELKAALRRNQQLHVAAGNAVHFLWSHSGKVLPNDLALELGTAFQKVANSRTMAAVVETAFKGHEPPPLA